MAHFVGGEGATYRPNARPPGHHYRTFVQLQAYVQQRVEMNHFRSRHTSHQRWWTHDLSHSVFRVLGRGAFGAVSAVQKIDTQAIFAMKEMGELRVIQ